MHFITSSLYNIFFLNSSIFSVYFQVLLEEVVTFNINSKIELLLFKVICLCLWRTLHIYVLTKWCWLTNKIQVQCQGFLPYRFQVIFFFFYSDTTSRYTKNANRFNKRFPLKFRDKIAWHFLDLRHYTGLNSLTRSHTI